MDKLEIKYKKRKIGLGYQSTVRPRISDPFYIESNCIKWVTTSWTNSIFEKENLKLVNEQILICERTLIDSR